MRSLAVIGMAGKEARRAINLPREQNANESVGKRHRRKGHDRRGVALDRFGETVGAPDYEGDVASIIPRAREAIRELTRRPTAPVLVERHDQRALACRGD